MPKLLLPIAAALAVAGATAGGATYLLTRDDAVEEVPPPAVQATSEASAGTTPVPDEDSTLIRWFDVTVSVPSDSGLVVSQDFFGPQSDPPVLVIQSEVRPESAIVINARTGALVRETVELEDSATMDRVLDTLEVSPLDRTDGPWPYSETIPDIPREKLGNLTFIPPDPASGITVTFQTGDGEHGEGAALQFTNGRSRVGIDAESGELFRETATILPEDKDALDRLLAHVHLLEPS